MFIILILLFTIESCRQQTPEPKINIAVAANMQFVMDTLSKVFFNETDIESNLIISSSGNLTAQILAGAPYDVFLSADMSYPNLLFEEGKAIKPAKTYAYGKLVLWSSKKKEGLSLNSFFEPTVEKIAVANPKTAPYGKATHEVLESLENSEKLSDKWVYGESVSQTNQFIISGGVDMGITSKSTVKSKAIPSRGTWVEIDTLLYSPIQQGVIIIDRNSIYSNLAESFEEFLFSEKAQDILQNFGYLPFKNESKTIE